MIAIVGPGAVGGLLAALLHRAGHDVVAVARPATADRIAREGITVDSDRYGRFTAAVPADTQVPVGAAVILTVKAYGLADVLPAVRAARPSEVLSLLNGTAHAPHVAELPGRSVCGSVTVQATRENGVVRHRGDFLLVTVPDGAADLAVVAALAEAGVKVRTGGSEAEVLWDKYRFLCAAALLTSWARAPIGEAVGRDAEVTGGLLAEIAALATADGVPAAPEDIDAALRRMPATMRTSLQAEIEAGRAGELEHLGGHLLVLGERYGIDTPTTRRIMTDLRARVEPR